MKFFIKTYGCSHNQADSLLMEQLLKMSGHEKAKSEDDADFLIVNTCTVKTPTEQRIKRYIQDNKGKRIIIAGCMTATHKELFKNYQTIGCDNILDIANAAAGKLKKSITFPNAKTNLISLSKNEVIEIVPISRGCLGNCAYCATKLARGELHSFKIRDIIGRVKKAVNEGKKEFWLTAEDIGCYGLDINTTLIKLLNRLVKLKGFFKIRLGMINPKYADLYKKDLAKILSNEKFFKFIHMPIQSGSDKILKLMNRHYSKNDFIQTVNYLRNKVKDIAIATDIIVGFPKENRQDFDETYELIEALKPEVMNISKYYNRPLTKSSRMDGQVSLNDKKFRAIELMGLHRKHISQNQRVLGKDYALADEKGFARTSNYSRIKTARKLGEYYGLIVRKDNLGIFRTRKNKKQESND
jgi:MiaB-like tRNA modifying enzyme